jgi:hypothetical protein
LLTILFLQEIQQAELKDHNALLLQDQYRIHQNYKLDFHLNISQKPRIVELQAPIVLLKDYYLKKDVNETKQRLILEFVVNHEYLKLD